MFFKFSNMNSDLEELSFEGADAENSVNDVKEEPLPDVPDLSFEQIMFNDNADQFNYANEDSSSDSLSENRSKFQSNSTFQPMTEHSNDSSNPVMQQLQIDLLKRQIEVQELMATELKIKIERTRQLMKMEVAESELRCKEISKRLES